MGACMGGIASLTSMWFSETNIEVHPLLMFQVNYCVWSHSPALSDPHNWAIHLSLSARPTHHIYAATAQSGEETVLRPRQTSWTRKSGHLHPLACTSPSGGSSYLGGHRHSRPSASWRAVPYQKRARSRSQLKCSWTTVNLVPRLTTSGTWWVARPGPEAGSRYSGLQFSIFKILFNF